MQRSLVVRNVQVRAVCDDGGADLSARVERGTHRLARSGIEGVDQTRIIADHQVIAKRTGSGPVITALGIMLPAHGAGLQVHAHQVARTRTVIAAIRGARVHVAIAHRQRAEGLLGPRIARRGRHRLGHPNGGERIGSQRLQTTAAQRNDDQALRVHHARCRIDRHEQLCLAHRLARGGVFHKQLVIRRDVEVITRKDGVGDTGGL